MSELTLGGICCCIGLLLGGLASNRVTALYYKNEASQLEAKHKDAIDKANTNADAAAELYEAERTKQRIKVVTVTREIERAVKADSCAAMPLDPGLRDALTRAANPDSGKPDGAVSPVPAAGLFDLGGRSPRLGGGS